MGHHFLDIAGARTLPTPGLVATDQAVEHVVAASAMGVVHGPAGLGKSYAVERALARHAGVAVSWVEFPSRPTMRSERRSPSSAPSPPLSPPPCSTGSLCPSGRRCPPTPASLWLPRR